MAERRNTQTVGINNASTGQQTIVTNPSAKAFMYIWEVYITVATATNLTFYNGPGALTGNINVLAGASIARIDGGGAPLFTIDPGAVFNISDSGTVQKSGWCIYSN